MKRYRQYCPILRASEIFAERWTPVIIRNVLLGCETFTAIERGAPGISKTLLTQRLEGLVRFGILEAKPNPKGRGSLYAPTKAGRELWAVCEALGTWGARWLEVAPEHLDPFVVLWSMCNSLARDQLPAQRVVVRFDFVDLRRKNRFWWLLDGGEAEVCVKPPGFAEDLLVRADSERFAKWHMGWLSWREACSGGAIAIEGPGDLARAFPSWNARSHFAHIKPNQKRIGSR
jgi:DNA-binding HxlR family transcriptional regulator